MRSSTSRWHPAIGLMLWVGMGIGAHAQEKLPPLPSGGATNRFIDAKRAPAPLDDLDKSVDAIATDSPPPADSSPAPTPPPPATGGGPIRFNVGSPPERSGGNQLNIRSTPPAAPQPEPTAPEPLPPDPAATRLGAAEKTPATPKPHPLTFNGIRPGESTTEQVTRAWGQPVKTSRQNSIVEQSYSIEPFDRVTVMFYKDKVLSIVVQLRQPIAAAAAAEQLELAEFEPARVANENGVTVGQTYPERGVAFSFAPNSKDHVSHIVLDVLDAQPFVLRAESRAAHRYGECLEDLEQALALDPRSSEARHLQAVVLEWTGNTTEARRAIDAALAEEPRNPVYKLTLADILVELGEYERAFEATQQALNDSATYPEIQARALAELGNRIAAGPQRDYKLALDYHLQAIKVAEPLAASQNPALRRTGRQVLINAHLAAAKDIAWGDWRNKPTVVARWLERAEALVADGDDANEQLESTFVLCQKALAACVGLQGELDATPWIDRLRAAGAQQLKQAADPLARQHLSWEMALSFYDAMQVSFARGDIPTATSYGKAAVRELDKVAGSREVSPADAFAIGRLYFRLGSIEAIQNKNHAAALAWFDKAVPLLEKPAPRSAWVDSGRQGETLISMAVSYWAVGKQEKALQLTRQGVQWMQAAVEDGILEKQALAVPYANLATMHRHLGEHAKAKSFQEMAERLRPTQLK